MPYIRPGAPENPNGGSHEKTLEMMELFAAEVMPHFREDADVDETADVGR